MVFRHTVILTTMLFIFIFFESAYNKTIIDSVSVTSGIVKAFGSVYPTLIISNVKKTHPITFRNVNLPGGVTKSFHSSSIKITRSNKMYLTLKPYPMTLVLWFNCFILSTLLCSLVACFEEILT